MGAGPHRIRAPRDYGRGGWGGDGYPWRVGVALAGAFALVGARSSDVGARSSDVGARSAGAVFVYGPDPTPTEAPDGAPEAGGFAVRPNPVRGLAAGTYGVVAAAEGRRRSVSGPSCNGRSVVQ